MQQNPIASLLAFCVVMILCAPARAVPAAWYAVHGEDGKPGGEMAFYALDAEIETLLLHVGEEKIHLDMHFHSRKDKAFDIDMAFPAAEAQPILLEQRPDGFGLKHIHSGLPLHLQVRVNGHNMAVQKKYFVPPRSNESADGRRAGGVDVTHLARTLYGEPILGHFPKSRETIAFLQSRKVDYQCFPIKGGNAPGDYCAIQSPVTIEYFWKQSVVPGDNRLEISYRPLTAGEWPEHSPLHIDRALHGSSTPPDDDNAAQPYIPLGFYRRHFCVQDDFAQSIRTNASQGRYNEYNSGSTLVYDWQRAQYWRGPVKNFLLMVDTPHPHALAAWCPAFGNPGRDKTSPTRAQWQARSLALHGQLRVLFVDRPYNDK